MLSSGLLRNNVEPSDISEGLGGNLAVILSLASK
jgi:hypothetical protein